MGKAWWAHSVASKRVYVLPLVNANNDLLRGRIVCMSGKGHVCMVVARYGFRVVLAIKAVF